MLSDVLTGKEIRRLREARGLTQEQLAQAVGVGMRTVGAWERGETVPLNRMGALEKFFGVAENGTDEPLRSATEVGLLTELLRRAVDRERRRVSNG
jgi:transcriptional regulator with XRE-family HTH domain